METNETLKNLSILLGAMKSDHLGKIDFEEAFVKVIDFVKKIEQKNIQEIEQMHGMLTDLSEKVKNGVSSDFDSLKGEIGSIVDNHLKTLNSAHESKLKEVDDRMGKVKDGMDADEEIIVDKVCKLIKIPTIDELKNDLPIMGEQVRDALELITEEEEKLKITAISGLQEILDELKKKKNVTVGGGGFNYGSIDLHMIDDETPTGLVNGSNKAFALSNIPSPASSLKVYKDGQRMKLTTDYTFSGSTITFVDAPLTDSIITVDFRI